LMLWK